MPRANKKARLQKLKAQSLRRLNRQSKKYQKIVKSDRFAKQFEIFGLIVLFATTIFWSLLGASINLGNSDQIVNSYLFSDWSTFHNSTLPGAHTFLIKWPIFFIIGQLGVSGFNLAFFTVLLSVATVAVLIYQLHKIEKRPFYIGLICLGLASTLLLVPIQPYSGALLPVSMAMIATRNLEYVIYLLAVLSLVKTRSIKSRSFWIASVTLGLLIASDKLFLTLTVGGSLLSLLIFATTRKRQLIKMSVYWLISSLVAFLLSIGIIQLLNKLLLHVDDKTGASPYAVIHSAHDLMLGLIYGVFGLATNFGANPLFDATVLKNIPSIFHNRFFDIGIISYVINLAVFASGLIAVASVLHYCIKHSGSNNKARQFDHPTKLSIMLITSSLAGIAAFILTKHEYSVDARYLTISVLAIFFAIATRSQKLKLSKAWLFAIGGYLVVSIIIGVSTNLHGYNTDKSVLATFNERNSLVNDALQQHKTRILIGDYWRVMPIKQRAASDLAVSPLDGCTHPRNILSTKSWQPDLKTQAFAYLLSLDKGPADFGQCTLDQVIVAYGRPNSSTLIAGSLSKPKELLLYYDNGVSASSPTINPSNGVPSTVLPTSLSQLPNVNCLGPTVLNIVAHEDDDLLFMSPDLIGDLKDGHCVRTVYITAGDAGNERFYWLNREAGSEAAYSKMVGFEGIWVNRIVRLSEEQYIRVDSPRTNSKLSLIYVRLPDGNIHGQGFGLTRYESLFNLETGLTANMHSVDGQSSYSYVQLEDMLISLMHTYQPTEIHTQANYLDPWFPDHSDHTAVSRLVTKVGQKYDSKVPIKYYIGYPIYSRPSNVSGALLQQKNDAFFTYAKSDPSVCRNFETCVKSHASYSNYLPRQYTSP